MLVVMYGQVRCGSCRLSLRPFDQGLLNPPTSKSLSFMIVLLSGIHASLS